MATESTTSEKEGLFTMDGISLASHQAQESGDIEKTLEYYKNTASTYDKVRILGQCKSQNAEKTESTEMTELTENDQIEE